MTNQANIKTNKLELVSKSNPEMDKALLAIEELKSKIVGNPRCGRSGCYGRGWTGYDIITDKSEAGFHVYLHACSCAKPFETEYNRLMKQMATNTSVVLIQTNSKFDELHHREISWKVQNLWQKIIIKLKQK